MNTNEIMLIICVSIAFLVGVGILAGLWWLEREWKREERRQQMLKRFEED